MSLPNQSDGWIHDPCQLRLSERGPDPLQRLFEVARGSYAYSLIFYPGAEQLLRVVEGAIAYEFNDKGGPGNRRTFEKRIDWLASERMISSGLQKKLHAVRRLQNLASHPSEQSIFNLATALSILQITAEILDEILKAAHTRSYRTGFVMRLLFGVRPFWPQRFSAFPPRQGCYVARP
jgi:Domain of unknown function (DUF4145)